VCLISVLGDSTGTDPDDPIAVQSAGDHDVAADVETDFVLRKEIGQIRICRDIQDEAGLATLRAITGLALQSIDAFGAAWREAEQEQSS
jgi:hypothetical protein